MTPAFDAERLPRQIAHQLANRSTFVAALATVCDFESMRRERVARSCPRREGRHQNFHYHTCIRAVCEAYGVTDVPTPPNVVTPA